MEAQIINDCNAVKKYFSGKVDSVIDLKHKGNNRLYKVCTAGKVYLLKEYSPMHMDGWARGKSEFNALSHLWERGFREIPQPINFWQDDNTAVYSFENGKILESEKINYKDIKKAVDFLVNLHGFGSEDKRKFGPASSACLSWKGYIDTIESRFSKFKDYIPAGKYGKRARKFLDGEVIPTIKRLKQDLPEQVRNFGFDYQKEFPLEEQVLTPADFGFHNILVDRENGKYIFLDFEYFGRDDPVRQVLEFVHHGASKRIGQDLKRLFLDRYKEKTNFSRFDERVKLAEPLVKMTWVIICLHPLSPNHMKHLKFSHGEKGEEYFEQLIGQRLNEAEERLEALQYGR